VVLFVGYKNPYTTLSKVLEHVHGSYVVLFVGYKNPYTTLSKVLEHGLKDLVQLFRSLK